MGERAVLPFLSGFAPAGRSGSSGLVPRRRGFISNRALQRFTIRSSMDCLIAAIAIENEVPIWHLDRDYDLLARCTALRIYRGR